MLKLFMRGERYVRKMKIYEKKIIQLFLIAILILLPMTSFAQTPSVYIYVALGDSLTVGYEPQMRVEWENTQTFPAPYGFVDRLYEQLLYQGRTNVYNYGILGLTTTGLYHLLQAIEQETIITANELQERISDPRTDEILSQVEAMKANIEKADLITITIGGNDFLDLFSQYSTSNVAEWQSIIDERIVVYKENVSKSLELIHSLNPKAKIVIADQYQPYPKLGNAQIFETLSKYNGQITAALEEVIQNVSIPAENLQIVYVGERFVGRELQLLNINILEPEKSDIHPKQLGYEVMAKAFSETLWGEYKTVTNTDPIGIVVNGKELETPYRPIVENGTTYVPVREYVEALGGKVEWDQETQSAIARFGDKVVRYTAGSNIIEVNGEKVEMKAFVRLVRVDPNDPNAKTYVPLRALAEDGLQFDVQYIAKSKTAYINP